jgi:3-hydroxybutyryl-CoA dehydrogenase
MAIQKVGVVGAGLMGSGIAQVSAQAGFPTVVREVSDDLLQKGLGSIQKFLQAGIERGKVAPYELDKVKQNLKGTTKLEDLRDCDVVVEAITENVNAKRELFAALDGLCGPGTIFATNTSSLSVTEMAGFTKRPDRFIGLHFFNPVPLMKLVEVVRTVRTGPEAIQAANAWCMAIG